MKYKGYVAKIEFDKEAELFHGEVAHLKDVITFQGKSVRELKKAFRDSVDDYLDFCAKFPTPVVMNSERVIFFVNSLQLCPSATKICLCRCKIDEIERQQCDGGTKLWCCLQKNKYKL